MSSFDTERRKIIRNLLLAGFALPYFVSCSTSETENSEEEQPIQKEDNPEELLKSILHSEDLDILVKKDTSFEKYTNYYNVHLHKKPQALALVYNEKGVQKAIQYARIKGYPVSIRSGGHSFEQFSSNTDGLVINLCLLRNMQWMDEDRIEIGSGALLQEVYDTLIPKKRMIPMGSCGTVGVGGLTLGGGHGFFSRSYGLTCDQVESVTFVDGQGKIYNNSKDSELLWALKGGGNGNFGVVTSFVFKTNNLPNHFGSIRLKARKLTQEKAKELLVTYFSVAKKVPQDCYASYILNSSTLTVLFTYHSSMQAELEAIVEPLAEKMEEKKHSFSTDLATSLRRYYGSINPLPFKNASMGYYNGMETIEHVIDQVLDIVIKSKLIFQIVLLGGNIQNKKFEENSSYPHRDWLFLSELQCYWNSKQTVLRDRKIAAFQEIQKIIFKGGIVSQYRNYPAMEFEQWEHAYYGENYRHLQKIKRKFDPENTIRHPQSIKG